MPAQGLNTNDDVDVIAYHVKPGDNLTRIIERYYGKTSHVKLQSLIERTRTDNRLKTPNVIFPGQLLKLEVPKQYCAAPQGFPFGPMSFINDDSWFFQLNHDWQTASAEERRLSSSLAPWLLGAGSSKLTMIEKTFATNTPVLREMVSNYESYKAKNISKGQYDYRRSKLVGQLKSNLGPTNAILNGTKRPSEVLRISRAKGTVPTQSISQQISRMNKLSKVASKGGVALSVVGLGIACHQIAHTDSQQEKNEILVESVGGLAGGVLYGLGGNRGRGAYGYPYRLGGSVSPRCGWRCSGSRWR